MFVGDKLQYFDYSKSWRRHLLNILFIVFLLTTTVFLPGSTVTAGEFEVFFRQDDFPFDSLFKIAAGDFLALGKDQLVILGRDYIENRATVYAYSWSENGLQAIWESDNLLEGQSPIFLAVGKPTASGLDTIIVMTNHQLTTFTYQDGEFVLTSQIYHTLLPQEINVADLNGDGIDELLVVRVGKVNPTYVEKFVQVYSLTEDTLIEMGNSPLLGEIRAVCGCNLDGGREEEILVEAGIGNKAGTLSLLRYSEEEGLIRETTVEKLIPAVPYGLTAGSFSARRREESGEYKEVYTDSTDSFSAHLRQESALQDSALQDSALQESSLPGSVCEEDVSEESALPESALPEGVLPEDALPKSACEDQERPEMVVTADDWGRVNTFAYNFGRFLPQSQEINLKAALTSACLGDFNGDGQTDLAVGGYPTKLFLLTDLDER